MFQRIFTPTYLCSTTERRVLFSIGGGFIVWGRRDCLEQVETRLGLIRLGSVLVRVRVGVRNGRLGLRLGLDTVD